MTGPVQNTTLLVDQNWLDKNVNEKANLSFPARIIEYSGQTIGAFREIQVIKGLSKMRNGVGLTPSPVASLLDSSAGAALSTLGLLRLSSSAQDAIQRVADLSKDDGISSVRKVGLAMKDVGEAIATWVYAAIFLTGRTTMIGLAQFSNLAGYGADFALSATDYEKAAQCEAAASGKVKEAFTHTKNYNMLRIAKATASVISALLAVSMLLTGTMILPAVAMIVISLAGALLAIRRDIHKEEGTYRVVNFDHPVLV